jgi:hypothetical protein
VDGKEDHMQKRQHPPQSKTPLTPPTGEELDILMRAIQDAVNGALVRRIEAIRLLTQCHTMLLRCQLRATAGSEEAA